MERHELVELHYITPIENLVSISQIGLLSHRAAERVPHRSVAMQDVQDIRTETVIPNAHPLHDYVNLYIHARNPMMWVRRHEHLNLCVVTVHPDVLDLAGAVVADRNASSKYARFHPAPDGLGIVQAEHAFARDWTSEDQITYWRQKSMRCAEVLIPHHVGVEHLTGVKASCAKSAAGCEASGLTCTVDSDLFFQGGGS